MDEQCIPKHMSPFKFFTQNYFELRHIYAYCRVLAHNKQVVTTYSCAKNSSTCTTKFAYSNWLNRSKLLPYPANFLFFTHTHTFPKIACTAGIFKHSCINFNFWTHFVILGLTWFSLKWSSCPLRAINIYFVIKIFALGMYAKWITCSSFLWCQYGCARYDGYMYGKSNFWCQLCRDFP